MNEKARATLAFKKAVDELSESLETMLRTMQRVDEIRGVQANVLSVSDCIREIEESSLDEMPDVARRLLRILEIVNNPSVIHSAEEDDYEASVVVADAEWNMDRYRLEWQRAVGIIE